MTDNFVDLNLICCDCGKAFTWAAGEQAYFESKELSQPKRCKACRELRRQRIVKVKGVNE